MMNRRTFIFVNIRILFLTTFLLLCVQYGFAQGKIYAVLAGISEYQQPGNDLAYCQRDAVEMYNMLIEHTTSDRMILLTKEYSRGTQVPVMWGKFDRNMVILKKSR